MKSRGGLRLLPSMPLLRRELLAMLRGRRTFWLLVLAVATSSTVPLLGWGTVVSAARRGARSGEIAVMFLFAQLAVVLTTVASTMATSINAERDQGTWDSLVTTRLSPLEIVLSKLGASLAFTGLVLIASAPAACTLCLLGGVSLETILSCHAVTFLAAALAASISLHISARAVRSVRAVAAGMAQVAAWSLAPTLLLAFLPATMSPAGPYEIADRFYTRRGGGPWNALLASLLVLSSLILLGMGPMVLVLCVSLAYRISPWDLSPFELVHAEVFDVGGPRHGTLFIVLVVVVVSMYSWRAARLLLREAPVLPARRIPGPVAGRRAGLLRRLAARGAAFVPVLGNPVFLRETAAKLRETSELHVLNFLLSFFLLLSIVVVTFGMSWNVPHSVCTIASALCLLATAGSSVTWLARETARGSLDFLRGTCMTPREIITGKLMASLHWLPGILAAAAACLTVCLLGFLGAFLERRSPRESVGLVLVQHTAIAVAFLPVVVPSAAYGAAAGVLASVVAVRMLPAILLAIALCAMPIAACLGLPRSVVIAWWLPLLAAGILALLAIAFWLMASLWFERFRMRDR